MTEGIANLAPRHGDRRARAYERAEQVTQYIQDAITAYRHDSADSDGRPTISQSIAACDACGMAAARSGSVTRYTIGSAMRLMGL